MERPMCSLSLQLLLDGLVRCGVEAMRVLQ